MKKYKLLSWVLSLVMALTVFSVPTGAFANEGEEAEGYFCLGNSFYDEETEDFVFFSISDGDTVNIGELREKVNGLQVAFCYVSDGEWSWPGINKMIVTNDQPDAVAISYFDEEAEEDFLSKKEVTEIPGSDFTFEPRKVVDAAHFTVKSYAYENGEETLVETIRFTVKVGENDITQYKLGWYDQERDEDVPAGDNIEYSVLGEKQLSILTKNVGDNQWYTNEMPKIVWKNSNPTAAAMVYNDEEGNECIESGDQLELTESNSLGRYIFLKARKPGDTTITAEVYDDKEDAKPVATLHVTIHVGSDDVKQYRVGWWDGNDDEPTLLMSGETFDYAKMGIASLEIYEKRPGEDWIGNWIPKMVWHSLDPDIAQLCYENADGKFQTTGEDFELNDDTGSTVSVVPQSVGTAQFSVDVYDDAKATEPVATVPMNIMITPKGLERAKYEPYINQCYAYEADYSKQMVYGVIESINSYNEEYQGQYPAITSDDLDKLKISVTASGKDYPATINRTKNTFSAKISNAKLGSYVKVKFTMGSYTWTDDLMVTQWIKPKYTVKTYTYNGRTRTASVTVTYKGKTLKRGTDYDFDSYSLKNVGRAKYSIWAIGGKYKFNYKEGYFKINPKGTTLKTPKRGKKQITVKWTRQATRMAKARITGYQIQLATNSKFTKGKKLVTVKGYKNTSKKIKKLKKKTKYFVRIRTYMKVGKYTYYSGWSKYKTVKTK